VPLPYARGQTNSGAATATAAPAAAPQRTVGEAPGKALFDAVKKAFAPAQAGGGLGDAMIAGMGPRGANMSTFTDPTSGQTYLQGGSGEEAMNPYRAIGGQTSFSARPAPATQRTGPQSPPGQRPALTPPAKPVPPDLGGFTADEAQRITPPDLSGFTADESQRRPLDAAALTAGGVPTGEPFDVKQFMVGQRTPAPTGTALVGPVVRSPTSPEQPSMLAGAASYFDRNPPMWVAPPEAGLLAAPAPEQSPQRRASPNPQPAPASWDTTGAPPVQPPYVPTTTGQQMGGLSPFGTTAPQSGFASMSLLPFEQWPPVGWGWAGPSSFDFGAWG
jgi:hypothetical protein